MHIIDLNINFVKILFKFKFNEKNLRFSNVEFPTKINIDTIRYDTIRQAEEIGEKCAQLIYSFSVCWFERAVCWALLSVSQYTDYTAT